MVVTDGTPACTNVYSITPFEDTTNKGGVYTVSISRLADDTGPKQKNFKLGDDGGTVPPQSLVAVEEFYDADADGIHDETESLVEGWEVEARNETESLADVTTWNILLDSGAWTISEHLAIELNWFPTTPTAVEITVPDDNAVKFGNVCIGGGGGGLTLLNFVQGRPCTFSFAS